MSEAWEYYDIIERKRGTPLSPLEKSIAEGMQAECDQQMTREMAQYLGLEDY